MIKELSTMFMDNGNENLMDNCYSYSSEISLILQQRHTVNNFKQYSANLTRQGSFYHMN